MSVNPGGKRQLYQFWKMSNMGWACEKCVARVLFGRNESSNGVFSNQEVETATT